MLNHDSSATGAQRVAQIALLRADGHAVAEQAVGGLGLGDVALFGGGAVAIDVADRLRRQAGVGQSQFHGDAHGAGVGTGDVGAVRVAAEADDFGVDARAARLRMFQRFQHQHAAAFADHQAVAVAVVGTRREAGRVVLLAGGVQGVEHHGFAGAEFFGAAGQHQRLAAVADRLVGVADALAARGAGAGGRNDAALEFEENADIGRGGVRHHADVGVGVQVVGDAVEQHVAEGADFGGAADRRAAGHAHAAVGNARIAQQTGVVQRLFRRAHAQLRDPAHAAQLLAGPVRGRLEVLDRSGQAGVQLLVARPFRHGADGAAAILEGAPDADPVGSQRADAGHAGDDDAMHQHSPPLTAMTWRVM